MKGISLAEFQQLVEFVQKHHKFGWVDEKDTVIKDESGKPYHMHIKYIDSVYDSRDELFWHISLRGFGKRSFLDGANKFLTKKVEYASLFDWIMAYLKGEWEPTNQQFKELGWDE